MEFWPGTQGQSPLYSKFGTVPGRNCAPNYHDRHQATHYPLYYGEQQDQARESSYWTVPGSRTGGAPQEYTNWTDQELTAPTSSHFPFILDRLPQRHQDLGEYQPHEARDREWTAAQRAARDYERGFLREGWQRRWEPCSPVRYNRDVSTKRSDSSYRELEAWAARYSHSLPRRRRIEAELRGASQGLLESTRAPERESRSGTDPRVAALQQVLQSANIRESGLWDRGGRQQAPTYYASQTPASDTSHMLDMKEKTGYQKRMFSQPPGYIAPPPYNSPHKSSPVLHHCDTSWEQEGKRQTYWSQPTLRKQDVSVDLQDHRKSEKEDFTKPDENQYTFPELEELKHQKKETDTLQAGSPVTVQKPHIQHEVMTSLQESQVLQAVQNKKTSQELTSKVIEGRKFRLNKKTGGMTIFCLVSRIAGTTETPSLPLGTLQTNIQNKELGGVSKSLRDSGDINQTLKLADEVDFSVPTLTEQSSTSDEKNLKHQRKETPTCIERETLRDNLLNKAETDVVSPEKASKNDADSTFGRQVAQSVQPASIKYPLWREPSFTSRTETESSSTCLKAKCEEGESDVPHNQEDSVQVHPIDIEVRRLDIKKDTESEDSKGLLVIDTTCVVVKMELIPSPKKEHVHYLDSTPHTELSPLDVHSTVSPECVQSNTQLRQDLTTEQNAELDPLEIQERPETELHSDLLEKQAPEGESEISFPCMSSSSASEKETLEERAERILGIPLHDCITEQQTEDATSLLDSCVEDQEVEPSPIKVNNNDVALEQHPEDTSEEEQSQNQLEGGQTKEAVCSRENDGAKDQVVEEGGEEFAGPWEQVSTMSEGSEIDLQLETEIRASSETETTKDPLLKSTSEEGTTEQSQEENDTSAQHPSQCLSPPTNPSNSLLLDCKASNLALPLMFSSSDLTSLLDISESTTEEGPDPELIALNSMEKLVPYPETSSLPHTPSQQPTSPLPPGSADFSPSSTAHADRSPSPSSLALIDETAEAVSGVEDQDEENETSHPLNNEISDALEDLAKDMTEELVTQQQCESGQPDDSACVKDRNVADEQLPKEVNEDPTDDIMEQRLKLSQENTTEVNILQKQLEGVQTEDVVSAKETYMTEEQLPKEVSEDPMSLLEEPISQENVTESQTQTEINILQQQVEGYITDEQPKEVNEDPTDFLEQALKLSKENATEVNNLQKQLEGVQPEDVVSVKETYMTEEQLPKEVTEDPTEIILEQTLKICKENATEVNVFQEQLEDCMTEKKDSKEVNEDPKDFLEQAVKLSKENATEVNILQKQLEGVQTEDVVSVKETYMTEEQLPKEVSEDPAGLLEEPMSQEYVTESQTQTEINILQQELEGCMTEEQPNKVIDDPIDNTMEQALKMAQENTTEVNILQQQHECVQAVDVVCVKESYMTGEQLPKEDNVDPTDHIIEQTLTISKENATEVNILQGQLEGYMTEEQLAKEVNEDPTGLLEETICQENVTEIQTQTEVNILQQQLDNGQEEDASCLKETYMTEEQTQKEVSEDPMGLLEQIISKQNATGSEIQIQIEILQDTEAQAEPPHSSPPTSSDSDCEVSQSVDVLLPSELPPPHESHKSDTEFVSPLQMDAVCPPALNPGADAAPAGPPPLHLDSREESLQFSSSSDSPPVLLPSSSTPPQHEDSGSVCSAFPLKEEPQYPRSLWDAVHRIRKHTAPDSENEEEEVSELWDPEKVVVDMISERMVFDELGQQEVSIEGSVEDVKVGRMEQDACHEEPSSHAEEDTLSCSSASSHGSGDSVVLADEDEVEVEEMPLDVGTESKTENDEVLQAAEKERCCWDEVKHKTAVKEEGDDDGDESVTDESSQSEECSTVEMEVEMTETEQKENDVVFLPSEVTVPDEDMTKSESVK